jgi:hypothetical protein
MDLTGEITMYGVACLHPFQRSFFMGIQKSKKRMKKKTTISTKANQPIWFCNDCPGIEKDKFDIEQEKY